MPMSDAAKTGSATWNYDSSTGNHSSHQYSNSLNRHRDVTEQVFRTSDTSECIHLLDALEDEYGLEELSGYENPDEVRISYHISGAGFRWSHDLQVEVDYTREKLDFISRPLKYAMEWLETKDLEKSSVGQRYLTADETDLHVYRDESIPRIEVEEFIENCLSEDKDVIKEDKKDKMEENRGKAVSVS